MKRCCASCASTSCPKVRLPLKSISQRTRERLIIALLEATHEAPKRTSRAATAVHRSRPAARSDRLFFARPALEDAVWRLLFVCRLELGIWSCRRPPTGVDFQPTDWLTQSSGALQRRTSLSPNHLRSPG